VQDALDRLMHAQGRTTVIIAHRLSTIKCAPHRGPGRGPHHRAGHAHELMEKNGLYARLYSMQFRNPEEELAALLAKARADGTGSERRKRPEEFGSAEREDIVRSIWNRNQSQ